MSKLGTTETCRDSPREFLLRLFVTAVASADPMVCVPPSITMPNSSGRIVVAGAGKASAAMALAVEGEARKQGWFERLEGLVVTRYGHGAACERIEIIEAAHPVPDTAGADAAQRIEALVSGLGSEDLLLCLISGGGSALLTAPAPGISAEEKAAVTRALLRSGAPIGEMNCVRKHISAIKGGRLAQLAAPARVRSLMISDVPGDDPSVIASGPTVPDPTTRHEALEILTRYTIDAPASVVALLDSPDGETPKPDDPLFAKVENVIVARPSEMLTAAERAAREVGCDIVSLGADLEGEARDLGGQHAKLALQLQKDRASGPPLIILSGGETTVTVTGDGRGGRNAEYALGLAHALAGATGIYAIACDTDGIDGVEDNAGVLVAPDTLARAQAAGLEAEDTLTRNDAYSLFAVIDDLVVTGPTRTNVNDFRAILIT
ncbi:MAG: glycerate kinase [Alphaproteobacteria bacterium]